MSERDPWMPILLAPGSSSGSDASHWYGYTGDKETQGDNESG